MLYAVWRIIITISIIGLIIIDAAMEYQACFYLATYCYRYFHVKTVTTSWQQAAQTRIESGTSDLGPAILTYKRAQKFNINKGLEQIYNHFRSFNNIRSLKLLILQFYPNCKLKFLVAPTHRKLLYITGLLKLWVTTPNRKILGSRNILVSNIYIIL